MFYPSSFLNGCEYWDRGGGGATVLHPMENSAKANPETVFKGKGGVGDPMLELIYNFTLSHTNYEVHLSTQLHMERGRALLLDGHICICLLISITMFFISLENSE